MIQMILRWHCPICVVTEIKVNLYWIDDNLIKSTNEVLSIKFFIGRDSWQILLKEVLVVVWVFFILELKSYFTSIKADLLSFVFFSFLSIYFQYKAYDFEIYLNWWKVIFIEIKKILLKNLGFSLLPNSNLVTFSNWFCLYVSKIYV